MRKINSAKLTLSRETLRRLSAEDLRSVNGGGSTGPKNSRCSEQWSGCADGGPTADCTQQCEGTGNTQNCASANTCA